MARLPPAALAAATCLALAGAAAAQVELYGVNFGGTLYRVNPATASVSVVGATGFTRLNSAAATPAPPGLIYASRFRNAATPGDSHQLIRIDPATGIGSLIADYGTANDLRALAFMPSGDLLGIREAPIDELVRIDPVSGVVTLIGSTGRGDLQGLAGNSAGELFACGTTPTGVLCRINPATGAATVIAANLGTTLGMNALEWNQGNEAWSCQDNLYRIDLATGAASLIGNMGTDMRGLAAIRPAPPACYPNCDNSTTPPILNVQDFGCFLTRYAAGEPYANCDQSTTPPVLNVADFGCFLTRYAAGCP